MKQILDHELPPIPEGWRRVKSYEKLKPGYAVVMRDHEPRWLLCCDPPRTREEFSSYYWIRPIDETDVKEDFAVEWIEINPDSGETLPTKDDADCNDKVLWLVLDPLNIGHVKYESWNQTWIAGDHYIVTHWARSPINNMPDCNREVRLAAKRLLENTHEDTESGMVQKCRDVQLVSMILLHMLRHKSETFINCSRKGKHGNDSKSKMDREIHDVAS